MTTLGAGACPAGKLAASDRIPSQNNVPTATEIGKTPETGLRELDTREPDVRYAKSRDISIAFDSPPGSGTDGRVWKTSRKPAVKVFERESN